MKFKIRYVVEYELEITGEELEVELINEATGLRYVVSDPTPSQIADSLKPDGGGWGFVYNALHGIDNRSNLITEFSVDIEGEVVDIELPGWGDA